MNNIGLAKDSDDVNAAIDLAITIFSENLNDEMQREGLVKKIKSYDFSFKDIVLAKDESDGIVGATFMVDRFSIAGGLRSTFLTYICVKHTHRSQGVGGALINKAILECCKRKADVVLLIARKSADHFYTKFGFLGVSSYPKIELSCKEICGQAIALDAINKIKKIEVNKLNQAYEQTYRHLLGSFKRHVNQWNGLVDKLNRENISLDMYESDNGYGYIIHQNNQILEIAGTNIPFQYHVFKTHIRKLRYENVQVHASLNHPLVKNLKDLEFLYICRYCNYGGHMGLVLNKAKYINHLSKAINAKPLKRDAIDFLSIPFNLQYLDHI